MGRDVRRVPADFSWPLKAVWPGFSMPVAYHPVRCEACEGSGYNPETFQISEDWYDQDGFGALFQDGQTSFQDEEFILAEVQRKGSRWTYLYGYGPDGEVALNPPWKILGDCRTWKHKLTQDEVDALVEKDRLNFPESHYPSAAEVNEAYKTGIGHDSINRGICVRQRAKRLGVWGYCEKCGGEGRVYESPEQKVAHDNWEETPPPSGPAYQIWENVTDGSPISPPFLRPEDLASWMVCHDTTITQGTPYEEWIAIILEEESAY